MCTGSVNAQLSGLDYSALDIYLQSTPIGPVPIPLFSMGMRTSVIPTNMRFNVMCMPVHGLLNMAPTTISGPGPGVASGMVCSSAKNVKGSSKFFVQCAPVTRALMDPTAQNGLSPNSVGTTLVPSQIRLLNPSA